MRRLLPVLALLALLLTAGLWNARHLSAFMEVLHTEVLSSQSLAAEGRSSEALSRLTDARGRWEQALPYLYVVIQTDGIEPICLEFDSSLYLLSRGNADEAAGQLLSLARKLSFLAESEQLTLENLF